VPGRRSPVRKPRSRPRPTRALVVHIERRRAASEHADRSAESRLAEAVGLARAIDVEVVDELIVQLGTPVPATLMGRGKVTEIASRSPSSDAELVVVNAQLSPGQQRNLERAWKAKVLDRTGLILEIFGRRARTREGALQVEHAHLSYQKSRLVRSWTHLERQRGGFGFIGGPGETQIEADRRLIQERLTRIEKQLDKVKRTRQLHRGAGSACRIRSWRWSATPMPASRRCSTSSPPPVSMPAICCSPPSTRPCAGCGCRMAAKSSFPTPSASSPTCRRR
jgi:GTP-binding protein HflX